MRYSEYFAQPVKFLRLYYNYFLVKWGFRKVLPAYFINRIEVVDCGEELVKYQDTTATLWHTKQNDWLLPEWQISLLPATIFQRRLYHHFERATPRVQNIQSNALSSSFDLSMFKYFLRQFAKSV